MKYAIGIVGLTALFIVVALASSATAQSSACANTVSMPADASTQLLADCDALIASKSALKGTGSLNWWTGKDISQWNGITVNGGRVTGLDLRDRSLDGTIPERLTDLDALTSIHLSGNSFTGCIPAGLASITNSDLATIGLSFCGVQQPASPTPASTPAASPTAVATPDPSATAVPTPAPTPSPSPSNETAERLAAIETRLTSLETRVTALEATSTPVPPPPAVSPPSDSPAVGSTVEAGDSTYRVNEIVDPASGELLPPDEGNRYVAADITQTAGEDGDRYSYLNFSAQDSQGYVYGGTIWADPEPIFDSGALGPNEITRGWVTFEVPESAVLITIRVEYEFLEPVKVIADLTE